jgi:ATP-dependent Zn protease
VRRTVLTAFDRSVHILTENRDVLEESAKRLLKQETLEAPDLETLFKSLKPASLEFAASAPECSGPSV